MPRLHSVAQLALATSAAYASAPHSAEAQAQAHTQSATQAPTHLVPSSEGPSLPAAPGPDSQRGLYIAVRAYGSIHDQNNLIFNNSFEGAGALGYRATNSIRLETEYASRSADIVGLNGASAARGDFKSQSLGFHAYYDFRKNRKIRPFIGGGGGAGRLEFEFSGPADNDPNFIVLGRDTNTSAYWNVLVGASWHATDRYRIVGGFEYTSYSDQAVESNIGGIDGINRAYNFFIATRWFLGH